MGMDDMLIEGNMEINHYKCPCGKGEIVYDKNDTPGFHSHDVFITCTECNEKYEIDFSRGKSGWRLQDKATGEFVMVR